MFFTKKSLATLAENPVLKENLITEDRFSNWNDESSSFAHTEDDAIKLNQYSTGCMVLW
jgi:hypothetical protein